MNNITGTLINYYFHCKTQCWLHANRINFEDNSEKLVETKEYSALSQKFAEYGAFVGRGDSTKVFVELGYLQRKNDSLQNGIIQRVNHSNSYYLNSQLVNTSPITTTSGKIRNLMFFFMCFIFF